VSHSFVVHFERKLKKLLYRTDWRLSIVLEPFVHPSAARKKAFTFFWLSHLFVSPERSSLFVTYQVHLGSRNVSWQICHW